MEGLLIAEQLRLLRPLLPAERLSWSFPDDRTAVLPLAGGWSVWICSRPPRPFVAVRRGGAETGRPRTPFQQQLAARAVGPLVGASQPARDRVLALTFGPSTGFVPVPGVDLVAELTGRNANLVLVDGRLIVGVERQVLGERNRYRELRAGLEYRPPPPYVKLDPVGASAVAIERALEGRRVTEAGKVIDGVGPELGAALLAACATAGVAADAPLEGGGVRAAAALVAEMAASPRAFLERWAGGADPALAHAAEQAALARERLARLLEKELTLARRKLADAEAATAAAEGAAELRRQADLLLAHAGSVPPGATRVRLPDFGGGEVELSIDPRLSAAANARERYDQARRREARAQRSREQLGALTAGVAAAEAELAGVPGMRPDAVGARLRELAGEARSRAPKAPVPGIRYRGPHGFEVVVGRNARENDEVTFGVAKSRDLWLHAQGYRGSHVIVRSGGKEVPFETVLFAARLAAGHSEARREASVAVDYTERKNVWKQKGGPPGAVNFGHHRTVVVAPARDEVGARGS